MRKIDEFKQQNPQYAAVPDMELADKIYEKLYKGQGVDRHEFDLRMGVIPNPYGSQSEMVQGMTLGFNDEIQSGLMAPITATVDAIKGKGFDLGRAYDKELNRYRAEQRVYRDENPKKAIAAGMTGGLVSAGGPLKSLAKMGAVKAGLITGGTGGAIAGFGEGEGFEGRVINALYGGGTGLALGGLLPVAGKGISSGWRVLKSRAGWDDIPDETVRHIIKTMKDDGLSPEQAAQKLQRMMEQGKPVTLADLGENLQALGSFSIKQPGAGRRAGQKFLKNRQSEQTDRILGDIKKYLSPSNDLYGETAALIETRKAAAAPLYKKAYQKEFVSSPHLDALMQRPSFKKAMKNALKIMGEEGEDYRGYGLDFNSAGDVVFTSKPNMKTLDYIKRGLDDVVEKYRDGTTGVLNLDGYGRSVNNSLRSFTNELKRLNPDYADALAAWSGPTKSIDAMTLGRKFARRDPEQIAQDIARLSEGDKHFYKIGVARGLQDAAEKTATGGNTAKRLMGSPRKEKALAEIFDSPEEFANFRQAINVEGDMFETFAAGTRGSATQPLQAEGQSLARNALDFGKSVVDLNPAQAVTALARQVADKAKGVNPRTIEEIAKRLYQSDPEALAAYMVAIRASSSPRLTPLKGLFDLAPAPLGIQSGILAAQE